MGRKLYIVLTTLIVSLGITGCGSTIPEMTEEQTELVSEYAAGLILKYDKGYSNRLVDTSVPPVAEETANQSVTETATEEATQSTENTAAQAADGVDVQADMASFLGAEGVTIDYSGYELCDTYPDAEDGSDLFFTMDATEGYQLMVLKFNMVNTSGADETIDLLSKNVRYRVILNGASPKNALTTMLLNDMSTYNDVVTAGATQEVVIVIEVTPEEAQQIDTISLIMKNSEESVTTLLQ